MFVVVFIIVLQNAYINKLHNVKCFGFLIWLNIDGKVKFGKIIHRPSKNPLLRSSCSFKASKFLFDHFYFLC